MEEVIHTAEDNECPVCGTEMVIIGIDKDARPVEGSDVVALSEDNENTLKRFD